MSDDVPDYFVTGARVWYRQTCRGGYVFQRDVPAIYSHFAGQGKRVAIEVELRDGSRKMIYVDPKNIRARKDQP